jgi:hypothetical protein
MGKERDREERWRERRPPKGEPLVIDLPEGQKLYVGQLDDGMAIEVATWRGVGEPDSRVARMIIAANRDGAVAAREADADLAASQRWSPPASVTADARPVTAGAPVERDERTHASAGDRPARRVFRAMRRTVSLAVGIPLSAAVAAVLAGWIVVAKPIPSLATELGLGNSGIIVAASAPSYEVGDEVLARVSPSSSQAAVVATVLASTDTTVTIATNGKPVVLAKNQIMGRLITTLPVGAEAVDRPLLAGALIAALMIGVLVFAL